MRSKNLNFRRPRLIHTTHLANRRSRINFAESRTRKHSNLIIVFHRSTTFSRQAKIMCALKISISDREVHIKIHTTHLDNGRTNNSIAKNQEQFYSRAYLKCCSHFICFEKKEYRSERDIKQRSMPLCYCTSIAVKY